MRTTLARRGVVALLVGLLPLLALTGCSAAGTDEGPGASASSPAPTGTPTATPTVTIPGDGVSLSALGFENGPVDRVFVPIGAQVSARVDQANNVTVVMTSPSAAELVGFYRRTATADGFTVTADDPAAATLTFAGFGWTGTFTGDTEASALLLRPAP